MGVRCSELLRSAAFPILFLYLTPAVRCPAVNRFIGFVFVTADEPTVAQSVHRFEKSNDALID